MIGTSKAGVHAGNSLDELASLLYTFLHLVEQLLDPCELGSRAFEFVYRARALTIPCCTKESCIEQITDA